MKNPLVIRDYPFGLWLVGLALLAAGGYYFSGHPGEWLLPGLAVLAFLAILLFSSVLTVTADSEANLLTIERASLLRRTRVSLPVDEIRAIHVEQNVGRDSEGSRSVTYRVVAVMKDGRVAPFRPGFSSREAPKESMARRLRAYLGIEGVAGGLAGALETASEMAQVEFEREQESITGENEALRETGGVHWRLETRAYGGLPVTRWISADFCWPGHFLYIVQKLPGQKPGGSAGLMGSLNTFFLRQSMGIYGFSGQEAAGLEQVQALRPLDPALEPYFIAYTSSPAAAQQILTSAVCAALGAWAEAYPLRQGSSNQLAVLVSHNGVTLASPGLSNPEYLEQLAALGATIVRAQRIG